MLLPYANNNGADSLHIRLDSKIPILAKSKISRLQLVSVAEQAGLSLIWSETLKTGFLVTRLISFGHDEELREFCWP